MAGQSDDCYFFYNSTCAKGEDCPFRHEPQALGSETTCELWENGNCFRQRCKFRHSVIEMKRSQTACYYETQATGCLKLHCMFQHTKLRPVLHAPDTASVQTPNQPTAPAPAQENMAVRPVGTNQMSIPVLGRGPAPYHQLQRPPFRPHVLPPMGFNMQGGNPRMLRPPGAIRYPQFGGMPQPMDGGRAYGHGPLRAPMPFGRGGPPHGIFTNLPYPVHMGREMTNFRPGFPEKTYQKDESGSSDFSDYSSTSEDEGGRHSPRLSARRRVQNSRREGNRRVVKSGRRHHQPAGKQHRGGSEDRKRTNRIRPREKSPDLGRPKERGRDKERRKQGERGQERGKELNDRDSKPKERSKDSGEEDEEKKQDQDADTNSPDIKVKTLEEILREKALKKLQERRAERKAQKENGKEPGTKSSASESTEQRPSPQNGAEKDSESSENNEEELAVNDDDRSSKEEESERQKRRSEETGTSKKSETAEAKKDLTPRPASSSADKFKVKTLEEILQEKKMRQAESKSNTDQVEDIAEQDTTKPTERVLKSIVSPSKVPGKVPVPADKVQQKQTDQSSLPAEESTKPDTVKGRRAIRVLKTAAQPSNTGVQEDGESNPTQQENKPSQVKKITKETTQKVRVKSFEEIMQEKRLRKTREEQKEEVKKDAPVARTAITSPEKNQVASAWLLGKSKSLPVIRSRKIKVVRRVAAKSEETREGSRPASPAHTNPESSITEQAAPEISTASTKSAVTPVLAEPTSPVPDVMDRETADQHMLVRDQVGGESESCLDTTQPVIVADETQSEREECASKSPNKRLISTEEEKESEDLLNISGMSDDENKTLDSSLDLLVHDLPAKRPKTDTPSYEKIVHAVSQSSHVTDLDALFSEAIGSLSPAGSEYADLHEDDLIMELDDLINE